MELNRRQFVLLTIAGSASCTASGCTAGAGAGGAPAGAPGPLTVVDAGPVSDYPADGVYTRFQDLGFFVVRDNGRLLALSAVCTHRRCKVDARPDRSFACKCHGSTFDPAGHVTKGPARRDLPELLTSIDASQHLLVQVPTPAA